MRTTTSFVGIGLVFGVAIGAATDHVGIGVALGIVFGAVVGAITNRPDAPPQEFKQDSTDETR